MRLQSSLSSTPPRAAPPTAAAAAHCTIWPGSCRRRSRSRRRFAAAPDAASATDGAGWLPLHYAAWAKAPLDAVELLLAAHPAAAAATNARGFLPLHMAVQSGAPDAVVGKLLDAHPAGVSAKTNNGDTPLALATASGADAACWRATRLRCGAAGLSHSRRHLLTLRSSPATGAPGAARRARPADRRRRRAQSRRRARRLLLRGRARPPLPESAPPLTEAGGGRRARVRAPRVRALELEDAAAVGGRGARDEAARRVRPAVPVREGSRSVRRRRREP